GFVQHLRDSGLMDSTIFMIIRTFSSYYSLVKKRFGAKVPDSIFEDLNSKDFEKSGFKMANLSDDEIMLFEKMKVMRSTRTRDIDMINRFLFMSYVGCRISDFKTFSKSNFTQETDGMWLTYTSVKTDTKVRIPLYAAFDGRAELIVIRYWESMDEFFRIRGHFNKKMKRIAKMAGITKNISAHVARHTCASRLVNKDVPVTTIQRIVGHRSLKTTMIYAATSENTLVRQLQK
ncbi:MAG: site-specific integrase, partial [Phocaeicola sp.]